MIAPANSSSRTVEVFLSLNNTVFVVDPTTAEDRGLDSGPFQRISVSPNGKFAGLYTADNKLWVVTSDFQNKLSEYDSRSKEPPLDVQWCANSAVVLAWEDEIHVVGPNGAAVKYFFDDPVFLLPDLDGIRLLTKGTCDFLQRVPDATEEIFKPGSTSPAAVLLDALEELNNKSPKADDIIQLIKPNLSEAVDLCIQAAGQEFDVKWQKVLLKAASFGKSTLELYDSDDFVEMTDTLRVLNAVRFYEIGLTLSYDQYLHLNPSRLIRRLLNRSQYLLAFRLADFLGLSSDSVYMHWAGQKAKHASGDEQAISKSIVRKLQGRKGVSFEAIARAAWIEGRGRLATELLGHEPRAHKQIPLLMQMQEDELALDRAIEGGDTDLMFYVLLALKKKMALPAFFRLVCERSVALAVVQASAREDDTEFLKDLYYQDDRRLEGASILMLDSVQQSETQAKVDKLKNAENLLKDNSKEFSFELKAIDEQTRLLKMQEAFDKDRPRSRAAATADARPSSSAAVQLDSEPYTGQSLDRTLYNLLRTNQPKRAQRLIAEFKMPDRSTTWLRLRALIARRDWRELDEWTRSLKKAPVVGWEVFFDECLSAGNARLAAGFIPRCAGVGVEERAGMWVKCGLVGRGAEEALKAKDAKMLETLAGVVGGREGKDIERMLGQLKSRR